MAAPTPHKSVVKETLISITIAFALAFVFRAFVVEAFVIPTGSMAPTLLGAHVRVRSPITGYSWPIDAWKKVTLAGPPLPTQTNNVQDPMHRAGAITSTLPTRAGDRILVFKYLYSIYDPKRFDVVVFKSPEQPSTNFIKRLVGLPGEQLALVDGDVFTRRPPAAEPPTDNPWARPGWVIQRKPERVQRTVWQPVYDSTWAPPPARSPGWSPPWEPGLGEPTRWGVGGTTYACGPGSDRAMLTWTADPDWAIDDYYPYNDGTPPPKYPVSDVRLSMGVGAVAQGLTVTAVLDARGQEFRGRVGAGQGTLQMRPKDGNEGEGDNWVTLAQGAAPALTPGTVTNVEFWHADQAVSLWVDGRRVAHAEYAWTPGERIGHSTSWTLDSVVNRYAESGDDVLTDPSRYLRPAVRWEFSGASAGFTLHRVALDRDLYYEPATYRAPLVRLGQPASSTHPAQTPTLGRDQFFVCGDNSPASSDARLWDAPDPWVSATLDPTIGVVPRDLLIGKAFFVYFPALLRGERVPAPDFGRMRWIW